MTPKHVTVRVNSDGSLRYYFRRRGTPAARLPDALSPSFDDAYREAVAKSDALLVKTLGGEPERYLNETVMSFSEREECLSWPFARNANGYGKIRLGSRMLTVSRLVCERAYGDPPTPDHEAAHSCGKGHEGCVNPFHLRWATAKENAADRIVHAAAKRIPINV